VIRKGFSAEALSVLVVTIPPPVLVWIAAGFGLLFMLVGGAMLLRPPKVRSDIPNAAERLRGIARYLVLMGVVAVIWGAAVLPQPALTRSGEVVAALGLAVVAFVLKRRDSARFPTPVPRSARNTAAMLSGVVIGVAAAAGVVLYLSRTH